MPGIGFGMGDVVIKDFLEKVIIYCRNINRQWIYILRRLTLHLLKPQMSWPHICVEQLNVAILTDRQVSKKVKTADKEQIPFVLVIGEQELASGKSLK